MTPSDRLVLARDTGRNAPRCMLQLSKRAEVVAPEPPSGLYTGPRDRPFDFSLAMRKLCRDITRRCAALAHFDTTRAAFTITKARNGRRHGLLARVTPMRFQGGALTSERRGKAYRVQRFVLDGRDVLYVVSFCLPRFLNRDFEDKLITVFHELYHIGPAFDGDLRRHEGRYSAHTSSQKNYDAHMAELVRDYLARGGESACQAFLRMSFAQICRRHGSVVGLALPRPKLIALPVTPPLPRE